MRRSDADEYCQAYNAQMLVCAEGTQLILATNLTPSPIALGRAGVVDRAGRSHTCAGPRFSSIRFRWAADADKLKRARSMVAKGAMGN